MTEKSKTSQIVIYGKNSNINVKNFENLDEFQQYYFLHKDEINALSTVKLNRLYHIKDYKITRRKLANGDEDKTLCFRQKTKDELSLKSSSENNNFISQIEFEQSIIDLQDKIKKVEIENEKIKTQLLEIIKAINDS